MAKKTHALRIVGTVEGADGSPDVEVTVRALGEQAESLTNLFESVQAIMERVPAWTVDHIGGEDEDQAAKAKARFAKLAPVDAASKK